MFVIVRSQGVAEVRVTNLKDRKVVSKDPGSRVPSNWCRREARTLVSTSMNTPCTRSALNKLVSHCRWKWS